MNNYHLVYGVKLSGFAFGSSRVKFPVPVNQFFLYPIVTEANTGLEFHFQFPSTFLPVVLFFLLS